MRTIKLAVLMSGLASSAMAQSAGFFLDAGGGFAKLKVGDFAVYNPVASVPGQPQGEALGVSGKGDTVSVTHLSLGYTFDENWDVRLSYFSYGGGEANLAFPLYPGIAWAIGSGPSVFQRHVLKYDLSAFTLMPSYTFAVSKKLQLRAGVGLKYGSTSSHIDATYTDGTVVFPAPAPKTYSYAKATEGSLGYVVSLGAKYVITERLSAEISGNYSTFKMKVPTSPWATASKSTVNIDSLSAELSLAWHW